MSALFKYKDLDNMTNQMSKAYKSHVLGKRDEIVEVAGDLSGIARSRMVSVLRSSPSDRKTGYLARQMSIERFRNSAGVVDVQFYHPRQTPGSKEVANPLIMNSLNKRNDPKYQSRHHKDFKTNNVTKAQKDFRKIARQIVNS